MSAPIPDPTPKPLGTFDFQGEFPIPVGDYRERMTFHEFYEDVERYIAALPWYKRVWVKYIGSVNYEALGVWEHFDQKRKQSALKGSK